MYRWCMRPWRETGNQKTEFEFKPSVLAFIYALKYPGEVINSSLCPVYRLNSSTDSLFQLGLAASLGNGHHRMNKNYM